MKGRRAGPTVVLAGRAFQGPQSWDYEATWKLHGTVVRVVIRRDTYDFQSFLQVDAWDPTSRRWNPLLRRGITGYRTAAVRTTEEQAPLDAFRVDERRLLEQAAAILAAAASALVESAPRCAACRPEEART